MELKDLKPAEGSRKNRKRVGRGHASGTGKTAGRGMNGQKSRCRWRQGRRLRGRPDSAGPSSAEAARLPQHQPRRVPARQRLAVSRRSSRPATWSTASRLKAKGIIKHADALVKVLGDGEITKALTVKVDKVSASAKAKIEAAGGKVEEPC